MRIRRNKTILEQAADYVEAAVDSAVEMAGPILADAKEKAGTAIAEAREQAGPALVDARDKAAPLIAQSAALAAEKAAQGKEVATAKAAEITGKPKKKKHRLRKLLLITGIAAALGFVAKKLTAKGDQDNWQSSYTPAPPPRDADRTDTPIADAAAANAGVAATEDADEGGAGPDEALADAAEESHDVTTPDAPAEVVDLDASEEAAANKGGKG